MLERGLGVNETHSSSAPLNNREGGQSVNGDHQETAALLFWSMTLDGLESQRIAAENRVRALEQEGIEADPRATALVDALADLEHQATLDLRRALRKSPHGPWVAHTIGIGEKQGARLLAAIGDPVWNSRDDRARRDVAELWAYCGFVPGQRRQKGVRSNWNSSAKMRAFLCAESCMKQRTSPFRAVYDDRRAWTAETHSDWTDGHSHNDALRIVAKAILEDLFNFGRAIEGTTSTHEPPAQSLAGATVVPHRLSTCAPAHLDDGHCTDVTQTTHAVVSLAEAITTPPIGHGKRASAPLEPVAA